MRVLTKKTEEEIRRDFFGPVQEAACKPYLLDVDPRKSWCELSELRLSTLICEFKPIGINKHFHLIGIIERMGKVFDNENAQVEIFLSEENRVAFRNQQRDLLMGGRPERTSYPPKYLCRPSLEMIEDKLKKWFGLRFCEENESYPSEFNSVTDYELPEYIMAEVREIREQKEKETQTTGSSSRKRRVPSPED
nr:protein ZK1127.3 [imported] - Caenorhabditis elegans [Caenorhabditis elegans]